jgi:hypothetical protein
MKHIDNLLNIIKQLANNGKVKGALLYQNFKPLE